MDDLEQFQQLRSQATEGFASVTTTFVVILLVVVAIIVLTFAWRIVPFREVLSGSKRLPKDKAREPRPELDERRRYGYSEPTTRWKPTGGLRLRDLPPDPVDAAKPKSAAAKKPTSAKVIQLLSWTLSAYGQGTMPAEAMLRIYRIQGISNRQWAVARLVYEMVAPLLGWRPLPRYLRRAPSTRRWRRWQQAVA